MVAKQMVNADYLHECPRSVRNKGAKLAYRNALPHLKAARLLADNNDYGNGIISYVVLRS